MPDISIIIPAYNPDQKVFGRCLDAIRRLETGNLQVECLIVDNNSRPAVTEYKLVQDFIASAPFPSRVVVEHKQGLVYARLCGIRNSTAPLIVFCDDDNELDTAYLLQADQLMTQYPQTGVFGPGIIRVDYLEGAPRYFEKYRYVFQETSMEGTRITSAQRPDGFYPYGTGMVLRREVARDYADKVERGVFTSIGRVGNVMTSCEDLQLIWNCIRHLQLSVGRSATLRLHHLINSKKANFRYWKRLSYGGGFSWLPARFEIFPEERETVRHSGREVRKSCLRLAKGFVYNFYKPRFFIISIASQLGILDSIYYINKRKTPFYLNWMRRLMGLDK